GPRRRPRRRSARRSRRGSTGRPEPMDLVRACAELGVTPSASAREAKRAYRKLVRRWHPDRFANDPQGQAEATLRLQRITEAYQAIVHALGPGTTQPFGAGGGRHAPGP